ncbi:endo-beta-N-acetylglucosaminidase [Paenibacillus sp. A3]|uniref:endo-beta-N-acetylglucosaminidase n=1 Tax=Paenibacillus sp. A3 TaxID=1337054 RepID=UPI0006D52FC9|nr:discoidin domain-containing protein [Paenibacillus sp. A3]KPV59697.1 endo-beta-N-acetylglucosaminidase [Paenibacillus sp. A3]
MKKRWTGLLLFMFSCLVFAAGAQAAQPHSSYWFPEDLLRWTPQGDKDAEFNRSTIALQDRFTGYQVNKHATVEPKVAALSAMNRQTSGVPSQGSEKFDANTFGYWAYVDKLVYWGGSSGEGIIVPPSADVTDAAHKNGVPVLGTVFFPPSVYGGKFEWVKQTIRQNPDGTFPVADKLLEVANYYGFDGWFINQETEGGTAEDAAAMQKFLAYLQAKKPAGMQIMWYDSMTADGSIAWQNALTDRNQMFLQQGSERRSDSMFLNFWWRSLEPSANKAKSLGRSPYELFTGIDVEAKGYDTKISWNAIFPEGKKAVTSLGIYRPDWAFNSSENQEQFYAKENKFWVGPTGNPANTSGTADWKGIAHYVVEQSPVNDLPFTTNFNTGNGQLFAVNGEVVRTTPWNNRSLQDVLPTWRWIAESKGEALKPSFDFTTAYYGGSSLKLAGTLSPQNATNLKLYKTDLLVEQNTKLSFTFKSQTKHADLKVGLSFADQPDKFVFLDAGGLHPGTWDTQTFNLNPYRGKRIAAISLYADAKQTIPDFSVNIGQLSVYNAKDDPNPAPEVRGLNVKEAEFKDGIYGDARLEWSATDRPVRYFEVYRVKPDGSKELLGVTPNRVYYVPMLRRIGPEAQTKLEVVALSADGQRGKAAQTVVTWPAYPKPVAAFAADKTLVAPGQPVTFIDQSSEVTEQRVWSFPGGTPSASTEKQPVVTYAAEGTYSVTLTAKNSVGDSTVTKEAFITVTKDAAGGVKNLALNKPATADGACGPNEAAAYAFDGKVTDNSKWCALGSGPHWLSVDLGASYTISEFVVKHAEAGGEAAAFNTRDFHIQVSNDGSTWSDVVQVQGNTAAESKHPIALTKARYVKLTIDKATQGGDTAARIYEFEVNGLAK